MNLWLDGSSHYDTPLIANPGKYTAKDETACTFTQVPGEGRQGRGCIKKVASAGGDSGFLTVGPKRTQTANWGQTVGGTFGHALKVDDLNTVDPAVGRPSVFTFNGGLFTVTNGVWDMFTVGLNPNGTLSAYIITGGVTSVLIATSVSAVSSNVYSYLEYEWALSTDHLTPDGALEIRWNMIPILTYTGVLFPFVLAFPAPTQRWNGIKALGTKSTTGPPFLTMRQGDAYLNDDQPSADPANPNDSFLGDIPVLYILPDGAGGHTNWTPSSAPNWSCVNEVPPDDAERITASAVGTLDSYTFEDVVGDPKAIQICTLIKKDINAAAQFKINTRQGGVDSLGIALPIADTAYDYVLQPQDVNPHTNLRWTEAEMNAGEWGPEKSF